MEKWLELDFEQIHPLKVELLAPSPLHISLGLSQRLSKGDLKKDVKN